MVAFFFYSILQILFLLMKILDFTMIKSDGLKKEGKLPNGGKSNSLIAMVRELAR